MEIRPHILFAEDDPDTRELVQLFLRHAGFQVSVTGESSEVPHLVATDHFDALLLDNWMPGLTGIQLCQTIRSFDQNIPISFALVQSRTLTKRPPLPLAHKAILQSLSTRTNSPLPYALP
jgi:DNA-binding response OmpR family regulator